MTKWCVLFLFTIFINNFLFAQRNSLEIRGKGTNIYVEHTVTPKENFYSVGRMYNVSPKELAAFNHLRLESGLKIGETIKIPLNQINFTQTGVRAKTEVNVPVFHTVESGETLYRLGVNYNNVPVASLKRWNHLRSNELTDGMQVIVGFLKVDKKNSPLANRHFEPPVQVAEEPKKEIKPEEPNSGQVAAAVPEEKKQEPETTVSNTTTPSQPNENAITATPVNNKSAIDFLGGYFKNLYNQQDQNKSSVDKAGEAGVFKSTSGWQDGKYYCFNNDVSAGTVLKITDNATGKSVYAKVLDAIPDIKQNEGLSVVISNAAADELGAGDNKFDCVVSFGK
ncbi:MAG TPA: LysM peptidoglycan-binding domain-containing protein [Hanamia sp.]|nr:LysM peptidoglycan-binding domain-containing protein [Hanamia sp.]